MKKLMCAVAALAAGVAMAEGIASANVVGYQSKTPNKGDFVWSAGTFVSCTKDGNAMTLKDIGLTRSKGDMSCGVFKIYLMGANGANLKITDTMNPYYGKSATFMYLDEVEAAEVREEEGYEYVVAGWYHEKDEDWEHPMDSYVIPYGLGYAVKAAATDYALQWNGQVQKDVDMPTITPSKGDFTWTGNAAPTEMALSEFALTRASGGMSCGVFKVYLMGANGANLKITDTESPYYGKSATYMFLDEDEASEVREEEGYEYVTAGWYHEKDEDWEHPMNSQTLDAGLGFAVKAAAANYELQLPGAL